MYVTLLIHLISRREMETEKDFIEFLSIPTTTQNLRIFKVALTHHAQMIKVSLSISTMQKSEHNSRSPGKTNGLHAATKLVRVII